MKLVYTIVFIAFGIAVLILTFFINFNARLKEFESTAKSKEALINEYVDICGNFIDMMALYGEEYLSEGKNKDHKLFKYLQQNFTENSYNLDLIAGSEYEKVSGSLTGIGEIPKEGIKREEINLALSYGEYFKSFLDRIPDVAWLYYTSENNFINIYPFTPSQIFKYTKDLKSKEFYTFAIPRKNGKAEAVWTPVYMDAAGKGLMVSLSRPVYRNGIFTGVVSLDLTTRKLGSIIDSNYLSYLIDVKDLVITASKNTGFKQHKIEFEQILGLSKNEIQNIKYFKSGVVQPLGNYYYYPVRFTKTPWTLYFVVPIWLVVSSSLFYTFPIILVCMLLFWALREVDRRRKTEIELNESLEEIKSYHRLLENSAKYDFLTNTCNRRGLAEFFVSNVKMNESIPLTFIMGDIDEFKNFNDSFGHTAGDKILIEISNIMKKNIGNNDVVCRWGGEEFVIMLVDKTYKSALLIAEKIRKQIEENEIPWKDCINIKATMTFGVAEHNFNQTMQETISKADSALYIGKEKGRNRVVGYLDQN